MKMIGCLLVAACVVISACVIYLVKNGVSLHSAPYIAPSIISEGFQNVPKGIFVRLFPDFQKSHYVLWGLPSSSLEAQKVFQELKSRFELEFKTTIQILENAEKKSLTEIKNCSKPCWLIFSNDQAHSLNAESWSQKSISDKDEFISITWIDFNRGAVASARCLQEKYLDFECLQSLAIQEVERKMKDLQKRYFFMRKYQDHDYFLFVEKPKI